MVLSRLCSLQLSHAPWRCLQRLSGVSSRGLTAGSLASQETKPLATAASAASLWTRVAGRSAAVPSLPLAAGSSRSVAQTSPCLPRQTPFHALPSTWASSRVSMRSDDSISSSLWSARSRKCAEPALVDHDQSRFYSPASLLEGPLPQEGVAGTARFQLWKKDGFLCVKASSMDFTMAIPVFVSDRRGYPSLSAILELWKGCQSARWGALKKYLLTAASRRDAVCSDALYGDVSNAQVMTFKHGGEELDMRWEVRPTYGKFWFFTVQR